MLALVHDTTGLIHLATSFLAMISGAIVLVGRKGTKFHKRTGYVFVFSMLVLLITAMFIYRLFGGFGIFHGIAIFGFVYLALGMVPALRRRPNWLNRHIYFMYWSVIGLYCAFAAEVFVRIPQAPFWPAVGIGTGFIAILGGVFYGRYKKSWEGIGAPN